MLISKKGDLNLINQQVSQKSDVQLVAAACRGDLDSFGRLYGKYYRPMVALAYSILTDRHLAEDAAQEAFARACHNLGSLKKPDKFASWLATICRNTAHQTLRNRQKLHFTDDPPVTESESASNETLEVIRGAVGQLADYERELIVLRYFNDLPYEQIAKVLDITVSAVHGRLFRARKRLVQILKRMGFSGIQT